MFISVKSTGKLASVGWRQDANPCFGEMRLVGAWLGVEMRLDGGLGPVCWARGFGFDRGAVG